MRLRLRFLVKLSLVVLALFFLLPMLTNMLGNSPEEADRNHAKAQRNKISKKDLGLMEQQQPAGGDEAIGAGDGEEVRFQGAVLDPAVKLNEDGNGAENQMQAAGDVLKMDQGGQLDGQVAFKKYGPKAVLKPGVLGNYEPTNIHSKGGQGDGGEPVYTSMSEKQAADRSVREFGFNMVASDKIAMDRTIPDTRLEECKYWFYPDKLPTASVIIVFHNEGWSTLMRTVHSVINMSPPQFLQEVIMVDDYSEKEHLKQQLEDYLKQFNGKVKLFRNPERYGLIGTRSLGAQYATGDVIVFLDAHCECNKNWLPPLLARIAYDRTIMAVPIIDGIDWNNFRYTPVYQKHEHFRGIFEWGFLYKESKVPADVLAMRAHNSEPYWSPTHAGGLFAMDRSYFFELGAYDPGLQIWGGENFELSFKIWQCGGTIEWVPCSRVGHVYRNSMPYTFGNINPKIPVILMNYMRVVEVWLDDEFKEYFYTREPTIRGYPIGNITGQLELKKKHQCKSFKWFIENIATEIVEKFPFPPPNKGWGEVKQKNGYHCWDTRGERPGGGHIGVSSCHHYGGNQLFRLNTEGQIGVGERCIDASGEGLQMIFCPIQPNGPWSWDEDTGLIRHRNKNKCAALDAGNTLVLRECDSSLAQQQWEIINVRTWS